MMSSCEDLQAKETDALISAEETLEASSPLSLHIVCVNRKPFPMEALPSMLVGEFKKTVAKQADAEGKYIRLIYQGKMLIDDRASLASYQVKNDAYIHCAISATMPQQQAPPLMSSASMEQEQEEEEDESQRRGFNRLRCRLSREEIQALRLHFYPQIAPLIAQSQPIDEDRIYRIEEEWMNAQGPLSEFALNLRPRLQSQSSNPDYRIDMSSSDPMGLLEAETEGTYLEFTWGLLMGMLLGFILLFWLWERSVPRKQKVGIVLGVAINIIVSMTPNHLST